MKIYGDYFSGNCYKIHLLAELLRLDYEWADVDILRGESRTDDFLAINPNGKIPVIELADGQTLSESNAILTYLATGSEWLPEEAFAHAKVMQWLFFEQYSHEPVIAVALFIQLYQGRPAEREEEYQRCLKRGPAALGVMEAQLSQTPFLAGDKPSVADVALYAYTHVAEEGGFDLSPFPRLKAWLTRFSELPGYVPKKVGERPS